MGRSHAASGAAGWLAACAVVNALGHRPGAATVVLGTVVAAGCATAPDMDHPSSTVARVFGPPSQALCRAIAGGCASVHARTRTVLDPGRRNGHRTLTHTAVFALAVGAVVAVAGLLIGRYAAAPVAFLSAALAARAVLSPEDRAMTIRYRRSNWVMRGLSGRLPWLRRPPIVPVAVGAVTAVAVLSGIWGSRWWWLGVPVAFGWLAHLVGDALTNSGCPILWPVVVRGHRWYLVGTPRAMRFCTGGWCEQWLVLPALAASGLASAGWLLATV